ncbi:lamin tail domain-containing protein [Paenibacillus sambharensis]|uniref:lamin tail domain-containing protein n=1 Tax=Paenibacillus sambharensis TaxID=1803190 RepID=UPI0015E8DBC8|nr:lamin tail domain-containing protein [Paenibacillus sambharensis]
MWAVMLTLLVTQLIPQGEADRAAAAEAAAAPTLVITEIVPKSEGQGQPYEFVEIYNTTGQAISLSGYQLQYFTSNMESPANRWTIGNAIVPAKGALVLWLKKYDYPNVPLTDFNAAYDTSLRPEQVYEIQLTTSAQGLHDSLLRKVGIAGSSGALISSALINDGEADGITGRSVIYSAAGGSNEAVKLRNNEAPTPGALVSEQLNDPSAPANLLITELIPNTANYAGLDAFEFIELYNASPHEVDLKGYRITSGSWNKTITETFKVAPYSTVVFWTRRAEIASLTLEGFNSYYYASYSSKHVTEDRMLKLDDIGGLVNSSTQSVTVFDPSGAEAAKARYTGAEVTDGKSIVYGYPTDGTREMRLLRAGEKPTPGWALEEQTPPKRQLDEQAPQVPVLSAQAGAGQVNLEWTSGSEADIWAYHIYRDGQLEYTVPASKRQFTVYGLTGGVSYSFEVAAVDTSGNVSGKSGAVLATPAHQVITQQERAVNPYAAGYQMLWDISEEGPVIPGLAQDIVPQGLAYDAEREWLLMVSYLDDGRPGTLSIICAAKGTHIKSVHLYNEDGSPYTGHAGGVAISREHVWIGSEQFLYKMELEDIVQAADGSDIRFAGRFPVPVEAAYNTYSDGVLWVGEFYEAKSYPTDSSHHLRNRDGNINHAWMLGYKLDALTDEPSAGANPDYILSTIGKVQGASVGTDGIILSTSYGRANDSILYRYDNPLKETPHTSVTLNGSQVPVWFLDGQSAKATNSQAVIVPMSEGIAEVNGELYVLLESGANKYRYTTAYIMDRMVKIDLDRWAAYGLN